MRPNYPDNRIRVNLTLTPEVVGVLDRMEAVTGAGRATIIREWLEGMLPMLNDAAKALEIAAERKGDAFAILERSMREVGQMVHQTEMEIRTARRRARRKRAP